MDKLSLVYSKEGIATVKEKWLYGEGTSPTELTWLDELRRGEELERRRRHVGQEYARRLAELEAVREHARQLGEIALALQEKVEEQERAKNATDSALEAEFRTLADQWRRETRMLSSDSDIAANFAFHQIIGMGEKALPLIFREMRERGGRWFWALRAITRKNPVRPEDRGNVMRMTEAWLQWGRQQGYVR